MPSEKNMTQKESLSVTNYMASIEPEHRRNDCLRIYDMMEEETGLQPRIWGSSMVGFGEYHYKYESGREGDFFRVGFSSRSQNISIYILPGYQDFDDELCRLGKHKRGKSCLYIKRLSDVDENVLREIVKKGLAIMAEKYPLED